MAAGKTAETEEGVCSFRYLPICPCACECVSANSGQGPANKGLMKCHGDMAIGESCPHSQMWKRNERVWSRAHELSQERGWPPGMWATMKLRRCYDACVRNSVCTFCWCCAHILQQLFVIIHSPTQHIPPAGGNVMFFGGGSYLLTEYCGLFTITDARKSMGCPIDLHERVNQRLILQ